MLYRFYTLSSVIAALTWAGCGDQTKVHKEKFANVVNSAKNADMIVKFDQNLNNAVSRIAAKPNAVFPVPTIQDKGVAERATKALYAYVEMSSTDFSVYNSLVQLIGSAHQKYGSVDGLFDSAVDHLELTMAKKGAALDFPNFEPYDFVRAVVHILTDDFFDVDHKEDVTRALSCASGRSEMCDGPSNVLIKNILTAMNRLNEFIPAEVEVHQSMGKFVFLPMYVFLSHKSIPIEFRQWTVHLVNAIVELVANAPKDPNEAQEYFENAMEMVQFSEADNRMLANISRNIQQLMTKLQVSGLFKNMNGKMFTAGPQNPFSI